MITYTLNTIYKITNFLDSNLKETKEAVTSQEEIDERIAKEEVIGITDYTHTHRKLYGFIPVNGYKAPLHDMLVSKDLTIKILPNGCIKYARKHKLTTKQVFNALKKHYITNLVDNNIVVPRYRAYVASKLLLIFGLIFIFPLFLLLLFPEMQVTVEIIIGTMLVLYFWTSYIHNRTMKKIFAPENLE